MGAAAAGLLISGIYMLPSADAGGETRTMTLYSVNTKEKLTTTYMVNGRHVPSELKKINYLLRDWRRDAVTKMDTETIDLMWELHADLGSKAPIHIISGYRSAETNAMLKNIGRNVAKKSMHIQGKAIDLYFPDVPTERLRNSALVREVGGVGYYPRSGSSGFVHVDSGRVRHWPGISGSQMAKIRRDYRKTIGARLNGNQAVQVASAQEPAEQTYPTPKPRPRPIEVLMMAAAQSIEPAAIEPETAEPASAEPATIQPVAAPAPVRNFAESATRVADGGPAQPKLQPKADLAIAQMTIEPVAAPAPRHNFAAKPSPVRDTLATELQPEFDDEMVGHVIEVPPPSTRANTGAEGNFLTALRDGIAAGAEDLFAWPGQLISSAEELLWQDDSEEATRSSASVEAAEQPFPPITDEDAAELEVIIAALRSRAQYDELSARRERDARPSVKGDRLSIIRSRKGDLILTAPRPRYGAAEPVQEAKLPAVEPVDKVAVQTFEKLLKSPNSLE